jgi:hypothetical protein
MNRKKMAVILSVIILVSVIIVFPKGDKPADEETPEPEETPEENDNDTVIPPVETIIYNNEYLIDQASEKLNGEAVQYKITFHDDDIFSYDMFINYRLTTTGSVFYLIYLTNGVQTIALHLSGEASGKLFDLTTFRKHRMMGKGANVDGNISEFNYTRVKKNESWYLTIAVANSINETLTVHLRTKKQSMELTPLLRTTNVTLSSAINADYNDGKILKRYRGISFLGLGFSLCYADLSFPVEHGGIICTDMRNQKQGFVYIGTNWSEIWTNGMTETPDYASILISSTDAMGIKNWRVYSEALGYPRKISLLTLVVDVYPYSTIQLNDWDLNHTKKLSEKILERNTIRLQKLLGVLLTVGAVLLNLTLTLLKPFINKFLENRPDRVERRQDIIMALLGLFIKEKK